MYAVCFRKKPEKHKKKRRGKYVFLLNRNLHKTEHFLIKRLIKLLLEEIYDPTHLLPEQQALGSLLKVFLMYNETINYIFNFWVNVYMHYVV